MNVTPPPGKAVGVYLPVSAFVTLGTEHVIANQVGGRVRERVRQRVREKVREGQGGPGTVRDGQRASRGSGAWAAWARGRLSGWVGGHGGWVQRVGRSTGRESA